MDYVSPIVTRSIFKKNKKTERTHKNPSEMKMPYQNNGSESSRNRNNYIISAQEINSAGSCDNMDVKAFDILNKIDENRREIIDEMHLSEERLGERIHYLEQRIDTINDKIIERYKFWIGISIPAILSIAGIIATILMG